MTTAAFVREHTRPGRPALVPELTLRLATDVVALWEALGPGGPTLPFWAAAWPGGQALARYVLDHREVVAGLRVLDLGAGSGLVAIAAARAGASSVVASDPDPLALAAVMVNAEANAVTSVQTVGDVLDSGPPAADVVLAGDVCYDRAMSARVLPWLRRTRSAGCQVLLGDPGRHYLPIGELAELASYDVPDVDETGIRRATVWSMPA